MVNGIAMLLRISLLVEILISGQV